MPPRGAIIRETPALAPNEGRLAPIVVDRHLAGSRLDGVARAAVDSDGTVGDQVRRERTVARSPPRFPDLPPGIAQLGEHLLVGRKPGPQRHEAVAEMRGQLQRDLA